MSASSSWKPHASVEVLKLRARVLARIRDFFAQRNVLEVETPLLCSSSATDPHLQSLLVASSVSQPAVRFLQTSPEFSMKRLLAAGSGSIFQICKAFRNEEAGRLHNPEFTMLEWYRVGFDYQTLMSEVEDLVNLFGPWPGVRRISYQDLFESVLDENPHTIANSQLVEILKASSSGIEHLSDLPPLSYRNGALDYLFDTRITPELQEPTFVYDYPVGQAALAKIDKNVSGHPIAKRFELFIGGLEIANGYAELQDADELERRFDGDNRERRRLGMLEIPADRYLLDAMREGLPDCAGVALGVDRLILLLAEEASLADVLAFSMKNC